MHRPFSAVSLIFVEPALVVLLGGSVVLAGCSRSPQPTTLAAANPAVPTASDGPDKPPGTLACHRLAAAVTGATLMQPGVVDSISTASRTADAPVAEAAQRLSVAYATALAAKGTDNEPDAIAAVSGAGAAMAGVCNDSGLDRVG